MALQPFTLAQLARAAGMSVEDVRSYRDSGLLPPPKRQRTRTDDFSFQVEHLERLRFIQRALAHGFTFENIARLVDEHGLVTCNDVYRISLQRLEELRHLGDAKAAALEKLIASCPGKGGRKECKILVALSEDADGRQDDKPLAKRGQGVQAGALAHIQAWTATGESHASLMVAGVPPQACPRSSLEARRPFPAAGFLIPRRISLGPAKEIG